MKGVDYFLLALLQEDTCFSLPFPAKSDGGGDNTNSYHLLSTYYLLCAKQWSKYFSCISSFNPHTNPMRLVLLLIH